MKSATLFTSVCLIILVATSPAARAQTAVTGAKEIQAVLNRASYDGSSTYTVSPNQQQAIVEILIHVFGDETEMLNLEGNPFLSYASDTTPSLIEIQRRMDFYGLDDPKITVSDDTVSPPKTLQFSMFVAGLADFLVGRAKRELEIAFFEDFRDTLHKNPYLAILFPETSRTLGAVGDQIYSPPLYIAALQQAFERDLSILLTTLPVAIQRDDTMKDSPVAAIVLAALALARDLQGGLHPAEVLAQSDYLRDLSKHESLYPVVGSLVVFNQISQSLRSVEPDRYWVRVSEFDSFDKTTWILYFGIIYQQLGGGKPLAKEQMNAYRDDLMMALATSERVVAAGNAIIEILDRLQRIQQILQPVLDKELGKVSYGELHRYFTTAADLVDISVAIPLLLQGQNDAERKMPKSPLSNALRTAGNLALDLEQRDYVAAVSNGGILMHDLFGEDWSYHDEYLRYGTFMATVAKAETSEDVQAAIEAIALPPGSYRIKQESTFSIALNAYIGGNIGSELFSETGERKTVFGMWAPVGVAFSWRTGQPIVGSVTLFGSLLDIGAVTQYRWDDASTETLPDLDFRNVFAPGAHVVLGIRNLPLAVGAGYQLGPQLRGIQDTTLKLDDQQTSRIIGFVAVDIPLIGLSASR